jgi:hypothetical protein
MQYYLQQKLYTSDPKKYKKLHKALMLAPQPSQSISLSTLANLAGADVGAVLNSINNNLIAALNTA